MLRSIRVRQHMGNHKEGWSLQYFSDFLDQKTHSSVDYGVTFHLEYRNL